VYIKKTILLLFLIGAFLKLFSQDDKVYTSNGDVLVGEIKSMQRGVLIFDTDYADKKFEIEWNEIAGLSCSRTLLIYTTNGEKYRGGIKFIPDEGSKIQLQTIDENLTLTLNDIVEITSFEQKFIDRVIISIDAGLSLTKANNVRQSSASGKISYRGIKWYLHANFSNVGTTQDNVDPVNRSEGGLGFTRDVLGNAMILGGTEFLSNSEQMLDLRSTVRVGFGYYIIRNNKLFLQAGAGLAFSQEKYGGETATNQGSIEGLGITEFNAYDTGDLSFQLKLTTYPSFSEWGRWRIDLDTSLKYDLPLDFYVKLSYVHNFDSDPLVDVSQNDYVFKTSIGWEWD